MHRRHLAAVFAVIAALAIALVLGADRLWGHKSSRGAVDNYIKSVDSVQQQMRLPLTQLLTVYSSFSTRAASPQVEEQLAAADRTLRTLMRRLATLTAPPEAASLRRLLVRLVAQMGAVADEVGQLAVFQPRFHALINASHLASARLAKALAAVHPPKAHLVRGTPKAIARARAAYAAAAAATAAAQADAVDAYDRAVGAVAGRLRVLHPPPVMVPAYRAQVQTLEATEVAGHALALELRKQNRSGVPLLSHRLSEAARVAGSVAAQQAEIAAIKAYNARVRAVSAMQQRIRNEVARLQSTVR